jgi:threonine/homoserine/homoserine lactone efflux protein
MIQPLLSGIASGLLLAVLIGPVFFALLQTSIERGFRSGVLLAVGVSLSDAVCAAVCFLGYTQLNVTESFHESLAIFGGLILIGFGISTLVKKPALHAQTDIRAGGRPGTFRYVLKGFALNSINPSVLLFWAAVVTLASVQHHFAGTQIAVYLSSIILTVLGTDVAKAYVATKLRNYLSLTLMAWMNRSVGIAMVGFGIKLIMTGLAMEV